MRIDDEHIRSYKVMSQNEFWRTCSDMNGDLIVGVAFNDHGWPREDRVLVIDLDPYVTELEWVQFEGANYFLDLDVHTVRDVTKDPNLPPELYPVSFAYYVEYDAYLPDKDHPFVQHYAQNSL